MKVLIVGASGMLGNTLFRYIKQRCIDIDVVGTLRSESQRSLFDKSCYSGLVSGINLCNFESMNVLMEETLPDVVVNCAGVIKQVKDASNATTTIYMNALLPHKLASLCADVEARLVHFSTDCVYTGSRGMYKEEDESDARDLYGMTKYLGEVKYKNTLTLRTSMIGHELASQNSLLGWFLDQENEINGYSKAIFSGLPTVELSRIICQFILPNTGLHGLYHVSAHPISKYSLLKKVAKIYRKNISICKDDTYLIDRSLDSSRFQSATGYSPPDWNELIRDMWEFQ